MLRELINKFNSSLSERMVSSRRRHKAPVKIWFDAELNTERSREQARAACIYGETVDISRTGIAFLVPSIRVKEKYLVGHQRDLNVEIDLPTGKIFMRVIGKRYEKVGIHISSERFLVGAHIISLSGEDRENYETFLRNGTRRAKSPSAGFELSAD
jgi:PilZ domain